MLVEHDRPPAAPAGASPLGPCFLCGRMGHYRKACPLMQKLQLLRALDMSPLEFTLNPNHLSVYFNYCCLPCRHLSYGLNPYKSTMFEFQLYIISLYNPVMSLSGIQVYIAVPCCMLHTYTVV